METQENLLKTEVNGDPNVSLIKKKKARPERTKPKEKSAKSDTKV